MPVRHAKGNLIGAAIREEVFLAIARGIGRGIEQARQPDGVFQFLTPMNVTETALYAHQAVEGDVTHFFVQQRLVIDGDEGGDIQVETLFQVVLCLIRFHAEHGEDQTTVQVETLLCIHTVTENNGELLPAHLQMVAMRNVVTDFPTDRTIGLDCPAVVGMRLRT